MKFRLAVALVVTAISWEAAIACQCRREASFERARTDAAMVVTGVVVAANPAALAIERFKSAREVADLPRWFPVNKIIVHTTRVFKGPAQQRLTLTHSVCCACEQPLEVGKEYLLFVFNHPDIMGGRMVSFCDPNRQVADARGDIERLGVPIAQFRGDRGRRTFIEVIRGVLDRVANLTVRAVVARTHPNHPWVHDPVAIVVASPWFQPAWRIACALVLSFAAMAIMRKRRQRRN